MASRSHEIEWSREAESDLFRIWSYVASEESPDIADKHLREIRDACSNLTDFPLSGRPRDELAAGLRSFVASLYVIFYRTKSDGLVVIRVLHGGKTSVGSLSLLVETADHEEYPDSNGRVLNCTFSILQATDDEFALVFSEPGQDI